MSKIIPRYLYHITTKSNYEKIVSSRKLATRKEDFAGDAIFMFELQNFFIPSKNLKISLIDKNKLHKSL